MFLTKSLQNIFSNSPQRKNSLCLGFFKLLLVEFHILITESAMSDKNQENQINQPVSEDRDSREKPDVNERNLTANPGDRISDKPQSVEEKAKQAAVDHVPDITGDTITVPTYFVVDEPNGEKKALHHVKDAEEISDVIRQARLDENGNRIW